MIGCPHCKNFEKTNILSQLENKGVYIIKTEKNKSPPEINSFPTFVYNKNIYSGEREFEDMFNWIQIIDQKKINNKNKTAGKSRKKKRKTRNKKRKTRNK